MPSIPEIMAPAGSYECLRAAIKAGANSVYFGVEQLNMRARAASFGFKDLPEIARICNQAGVKTYLTLNTILYDHDMAMVRRICAAAKEAGLSAVIAMDIATIQIAREAGLAVHLSTQVNVTNIEAVKFYAAMADVIVLARELTLKQIAHICRQIEEQDIRGPGGNRVGIEIFVHGALCIAVSGKCGMSLATYNASANRGACLQNCRRSYKVTDNETGDELVIDNEFVMSPSDLCTLPFLDQIIAAGVSVLKIEGRARAPEYVYATTRAYAEAARAAVSGTYTPEKLASWMEQVRAVYNRGFWEGGYYLGKKISEWSESNGSKATKEKFYVGVVTNYYKKIGVAEIEIRGVPLVQGDELAITGPTTGLVQFFPDSFRADDRETERATKGQTVTLRCTERLRLNDKVYALRDRVTQAATEKAPSGPTT
jgi:putative protease